MLVVTVYNPILAGNPKSLMETAHNAILTGNPKFLVVTAHRPILTGNPESLMVTAHIPWSVGVNFKPFVAKTCEYCTWLRVVLKVHQVVSTT